MITINCDSCGKKLQANMVCSVKIVISGNKRQRNNQFCQECFRKVQVAIDKVMEDSVMLDILKFVHNNKSKLLDEGTSLHMIEDIRKGIDLKELSEKYDCHVRTVINFYNKWCAYELEKNALWESPYENIEGVGLKADIQRLTLYSVDIDLMKIKSLLDAKWSAAEVSDEFVTCDQVGVKFAINFYRKYKYFPEELGKNYERPRTETPAHDPNADSDDLPFPLEED